MSDETVQAMARTVEREVKDLSTEVLGVRIENDDDYEVAGGYLLAVKKKQKQVEDAFADPVKKAHEAHKAIVALRRSILVPMEKAEAHLKRAIADYKDALRVKLMEQEARLQEEARKQAEDAALAKAEKLEAQGKKEEAADLLASEVKVPAVTVSKEAPKIAGLATREVWDFVIVDEAKVPDEYWVLDEQKIRGVVRAMRESTSIPGVEVTKRTVVVAGG